jgi:hypothetical protein
MLALKTTAAFVAAISAAAAHAGAPANTPAIPPSGFGGSEPVHIATIGQIEIDLEPSSAPGLRQVPCARTASRTTTCFVGR